MSEFILHHYAFSPYSEKIRLMLGYTNTPWLSAITKEMPPRRDLAKLAGGYQRIPVAQIGADIFCDSNLIAEEISKLAADESLSLFSASQEVREFVELAEGQVFFACVMASGGPVLRKKAMQQLGVINITRFLIDRLKMGRKAKIKMVSAKRARPITESFLSVCEEKLQTNFMFGEQPNIADFSAYHCLWFIRDLGERSFIQNYPKVVAWMDRMRAFAKPAQREISAKEAISIAIDSTPIEIANFSIQVELLNQQVEVAPTDYRLTGTQGVLVGQTEHSYVLQRKASKSSVVHTHFPQQGYQIKTRN